MGCIMNIIEKEILLSIQAQSFTTQRALSEYTGVSLGSVNQAVRSLTRKGLLQNMQLTAQAKDLLLHNKPKNAIILAAGYGLRMVPINAATPKALLEVKGQTLIERLILQLKEVGVEKIYIVVGHLKEHLEFLIDDYNVEFIVNKEYATTNSLHSLALAKYLLGDSYIVPCDVWCAKNPFAGTELYSWFLLKNTCIKHSHYFVNRKMEVTKQIENYGNAPLGICYLGKECASQVQQNIETLLAIPQSEEMQWEEALFIKNKMLVAAKLISKEYATEINTYEQLRELDADSNQLKSDAMDIICKTFSCTVSDIMHINVLKKGMTNRSFLFTVFGKKYIMRIPGEGTNHLINRKQEEAVYKIIADKNICDTLCYINADNGYKITAFLENARVCDPYCEEDIIACMQRLKAFHQMGLKVEHRFDMFAQLQHYEDLFAAKSIYRDYAKTKANILSLQDFIQNHKEEDTLCHIDSIADNFMFHQNQIYLIDWEYAGMQDPHVDIAMFCIYSMLNKQQIDHVIDIYFEQTCEPLLRKKIYAYIAVCSLLWSNWCEYKRTLGKEFGEYSLKQYRYAKEFYQHFQNIGESHE